MSGRSRVEVIDEVVFQARLTVAMLDNSVVVRDPEEVARGLKQALIAYDSLDEAETKELNERTK